MPTFSSTASAADTNNPSIACDASEDRYVFWEENVENVVQRKKEKRFGMKLF